MTEKNRPDSDQTTPNKDLVRLFERLEFSDAGLISFITSAIVVPSYDTIKRDFGIIRSEYLLLMCLSHFPTLTAKDVSFMTGRPRNSISRAVHRMLSVGYVTRSDDPEDGRKAKLRITPDGRALHEQIVQILVQREAQVLGVLNKKERAELRKLVNKVAIHASQLKG